MVTIISLLLIFLENNIFQEVPIDAVALAYLYYIANVKKGSSLWKVILVGVVVGSGGLSLEASLLIFGIYYLLGILLKNYIAFEGAVIPVIVVFQLIFFYVAMKAYGVHLDEVTYLIKGAILLFPLNYGYIYINNREKYLTV